MSCMCWWEQYVWRWREEEKRSGRGVGGNLGIKNELRVCGKLAQRKQSQGVEGWAERITTLSLILSNYAANNPGGMQRYTFTSQSDLFARPCQSLA